MLNEQCQYTDITILLRERLKKGIAMLDEKYQNIDLHRFV